jgi:hypothetical protein
MHGISKAQFKTRTHLVTIVPHVTQGERWLKPYHRSYREFLQKEARTQRHGQFTTPALENLTTHVDLANLSPELREESTDIQKEWVRIWLKLSIRSNNALKLNKCATNLDAWRLVERKDRNFSLIIKQIAAINPTEFNSDEFIKFYKDLAKRLKTWTNSELLVCTHEDNRPYEYHEIIDMVTQINTFKARPGTLSLVDYVLNSILHYQQRNLTKLSQKSTYFRYS